MARLVLLLATLLLPLTAIAPAADAAKKRPPKSAAKRTTCKTAKAKKGKSAKRKAAACKKSAKRKRTVKKQAGPLTRPLPAPPLIAAPPAPPAPPADQTPPAQPAPAPPPPPAPRPLPSFDFAATPNPVAVDPTADTGRAKSKYLDWQGGTVEATGADGAKYRLTVPQGALVDQTKITVTPLAKVDGLPFGGGLRAGAELSPGGLRFLKEAKLEIIGGPSIDPALETGFAYHGDGHDLHLAPMVRDPKVHGFTIQHFSAYGIAHATDAERRAQLVRTTQSTERQLEQIVAQELQLDRQHQLGLPGGAPMRIEVIEGALTAYHDQVLRPLMQAALTDDAMVGRAINRYLAWERSVVLMLGDDDLRAQRDARAADFRKVIENASARAFERCMAGHPEEFPVLLAWDRTTALLGIEVPSLVDRMRKCARFELDLDTSIRQLQDHGADEGPEDWRGHLAAEDVQLVFQDSWRVAGEGVFDYDHFSVTIPPHEGGTGCWQGGGDWDRTGAIVASDLHADLNTLEDVDGDEYQLAAYDVADWRLTLSPLATREFIFWSDCGGSTGSGGFSMWLGIMFQELHEDTARPFAPVEITGWSPAGPATWKVEFDRTRTVQDHATTEDTTFTLRHAPDPGA